MLFLSHNLYSDKAGPRQQLAPVYSAALPDSDLDLKLIHETTLTYFKMFLTASEHLQSRSQRKLGCLPRDTAALEILQTPNCDSLTGRNPIPLTRHAHGSCHSLRSFQQIGHAFR